MKQKIPLNNLQGKNVVIVLRRGIGNGTLLIKKHRGVLLEFDNRQVCIKSQFSKRELWLRRPCTPRDDVFEEVKEVKNNE